MAIIGTAIRNRQALKNVRCTGRGLTIGWSACCQPEKRGQHARGIGSILVRKGRVQAFFLPSHDGCCAFSPATRPMT